MKDKNSCCAYYCGGYCLLDDQECSSFKAMKHCMSYEPIDNHKSADKSRKRARKEKERNKRGEW